MSYKSRGNYHVNWCGLTDCRNRDKHCVNCILVRGERTNYEAKKKKGMI